MHRHAFLYTYIIHINRNRNYVKQKRNYEYEVLNDVNMSIKIDIELATIKLKSNIIIVSLSRSSYGNFKLFTEALVDVFTYVTQYDTKIFIVGDFNINIFLGGTNNGDTLQDLFQSFNLYITGDLPIRITFNREIYTDNIFINTDKVEYNAETINLHMRDHLAQMLVCRRLQQT